jgi:hypothetical protein
MFSLLTKEMNRAAEDECGSSPVSYLMRAIDEAQKGGATDSE